ncbi:hypothetical protein J3459_011916 [Metarhizium acridum]|nr:hypothetical protein J3459_011916 [Metarhizium acridum]
MGELGQRNNMNNLHSWGLSFSPFIQEETSLCVRGRLTGQNLYVRHRGWWRQGSDVAQGDGPDVLRQVMEGRVRRSSSAPARLVASNMSKHEAAVEWNFAATGLVLVFSQVHYERSLYTSYYY